MKIWLKYLLGIALGIIAAFLIPAESAQAISLLDFIVDIVLRFGRYMLLPLMFFSVATAFFTLQEEHLLLKTSVWTFSVIVISSLALAVLGLVSALIIHLPRIPITIEKINDIPTLGVRPMLSMLFPYSGFSALLEGAYLLPCFVFAGLAGAGAASDKVASRPAITLFDSLSKVCYIVMSFFIELLAVGMVALMCRWTINFIVAFKAGVYLQLIIMLAVNLILVAFVFYPLVLYLLCHDQHPYRVLYASFCTFLAGFFSGDTNLTLVIAMRHGKESLGIRRRINAVTFPLFSIFARGGAALVETICFILILRSYSKLGISVSDTLWILIISFAISFILGQLPFGGPFVAIIAMCTMYGRGFESGYLLLKDAAPILCAFAAGLDALTAVFGSYIVAVKTRTIEHIELRKFI
ncbi:MAG: dicarboxylate/amino acid:cation symporter [Treponema sp.]|nr:dicarboxylate/amino acid:cation symporter [Treponema sp.]